VFASSSARLPAQGLVEYVSPYGKTVTHIRGIMFVDAIENLRAAGVLPRYESRIANRHLCAISEALATTWIPVEHVVAHYAACDELSMSDAQMNLIGARIAKRISSTFFAGLVRRARGAGVESFRFALSHNDKLAERMYMGGKVSVVVTGPKDAVVETSGLPFATSRCFRTGFVAFGEAIAATFCKAAVVRLARPRTADPHCLSLAYSWV
jgi:hypothetical protein